MSRRFEFAESFEKSRKILGLSYREFGQLMGFSEEAMRRTADGRQIPQFEQQIIDRLTLIFADRPVDSVLEHKNILWDRKSMVEMFVGVTKRFAMTLENIIRFSDIASRFGMTVNSARELITELPELDLTFPNIDIWKSTLVNEAVKLANPTIETLLEPKLVELPSLRSSASI